MITATGLGSGLDIQGLVDSLVAAERAGSDLQLNRQSAKLQAKFSGLGSLKSSLSSFQSSLSSLTTLGTFEKNTATSSATTEMGVSADSSAAANTYSIEINQLAVSHSLASGAIADTDTTTLGSGSLTFRFGTTDYDEGLDSYNGFTLNTQRSAATITIDDGNNTLDGVMNAINEADIGVNASIVYDGTGYRLLVTSEDTGSNNSLEISVGDIDGNNTDVNGLSQFAFNASATNVEQTAAAQDSQLLINGLSISNASNTVSNAITGVTLSLNQVSTGPINVVVEPDTDSIVNAVNTFVSGYNDYIATVNSLSAYDAENNVAAALVGDFTLRSIEGQIDSMLRGSIPGLASSVTTLSGIGITTSAEGTLVLDSARLNDALEENPEVVTQLFAAFGAGGDNGISYLGSTSATVVGNYNVEITSLAQASVYEGASELPDFSKPSKYVEIDNDNDNLTLAIDGVEAGEITFTHATYSSGAALAEALQTQINSAAAFNEAGVSVSVTYNSSNDNLVITSNLEGSSSAVEILAVDSKTSNELGLDVGSGTSGTDLSGSIGGVPATVTGNVLIASSGTDAEGLSLAVTGNTIGNRGNVNFTRGVAAQLDRLLGKLLDAESALSDRIDSFDDKIDDIEDRREELNLRWERIRDRYSRQFNALDLLLGQLQNTSTYLEGQLGNLLKPNTGNNE